jgi:acetyltransferase-like isoleucine patch superfamily enzyme
MFSEDVQIRTSESHPIFDETRTRVNPGKSIRVGDHVWVGSGALILKGAQVGGGTVIGARSVVTRQHVETNVILARSPASIVRTGIRWARR